MSYASGVAEGILIGMEKTAFRFMDDLATAGIIASLLSPTILAASQRGTLMRGIETKTKGLPAEYGRTGLTAGVAGGVAGGLVGGGMGLARSGIIRPQKIIPRSVSAARLAGKTGLVVGLLSALTGLGAHAVGRSMGDQEVKVA